MQHHGIPAAERICDNRILIHAYVNISVTRGLAPQGRGRAPLAPCAPGARGLLGKRFPASPKLGNSRKRTRGRAPCFAARSGEGGLLDALPPPFETGGLPDAPS